jgi:hypothetical protein
MLEWLAYPDNDFKGIKGQTLIKSDKKLSGPGNSKLNVLGKFLVGRTTFCEMSHV